MSGPFLLAGDRFACLTSATRARALQHVLFDRDDTDSFRIQFENLSDVHGLTRAQVLPALPAGSAWARQAIGWESYIVFPSHRLGSRNLALIGMECVVSHDTRGAYPVFAGSVVDQAHVPELLTTIAATLYPGEVNTIQAARGIVHSDAKTPQQHMRTAARILRSASSSFLVSDPPIVRTTLLTEDEVPRNWLFHRGEYLLGAVGGLLTRLSRRRSAALSVVKTML